jgi:hypothetical protein
MVLKTPLTWADDVRVRRFGHTAFRVIAPLALTCKAAMTRPVLGRVCGVEAVSHWHLPTSDGRGETGHSALS